MSARTVIAALSAAALAACSTPDVSPVPQEPGDSTSQPSLNVPFDLRYGQTVSLQDISLQITFSELLVDSLCQDGVTCFWEGAAVVQLQITSGADPTFVDLHMSPGATVATGGYTIQIEDVWPEPGSTGSQIDPTLYVLRLRASQS